MAATCESEEFSAGGPSQRTTTTADAFGSLHTWNRLRLSNPQIQGLEVNELVRLGDKGPNRLTFTAPFPHTHSHEFVGSFSVPMSDAEGEAAFLLNRYASTKRLIHSHSSTGAAPLRIPR
jgi:hypothetical protein